MLDATSLSPRPARRARRPSLATPRPGHQLYTQTVEGPTHGPPHGAGQSDTDHLQQCECAAAKEWHLR
jgi:hypothetical protein